MHKGEGDGRCIRGRTIERHESREVLYIAYTPHGGELLARPTHGAVELDEPDVLVSSHLRDKSAVLERGVRAEGHRGAWRGMEGQART